MEVSCKFTILLGAHQQGFVFGNVAAAEDSTYALGSFNTDGFTVYKDANNDQQNANGSNYCRMVLEGWWCCSS